MSGARFDRYAGVGRRVLGQVFAKLTQLDQGSVRIIEDIAFGQGSMVDEHVVVFREKGKIRRHEGDRCRV